MVMDDDDIEASRRQDQRGTPSKAKRDAVEQRKYREKIGRKAYDAKQAKDARAYGECLRLLRISEGSKEWKNAWEFFYRA
jgi:hypothetical protein